MKIYTIPALIFALAGCDSDSEPSVLDGTYGLSGHISGLTGEITLEVNGTDEIVTANGDFVLESRVNNGESYLVTIESTSDNINCTLSNGSGTSESNVNDIVIECDGENQVAYSLNGLAFNTEEPSIVTFAFHLVDRYTETAIDFINTENLTDFVNVTENNLAISASESFLEIDQLANLNAQYHTVFAIDISSSLSVEELSSIKSLITNAIIDTETNESKLSSNQFITLLTFDSEIEVVVSQSQDPDVLLAALNSDGNNPPITIGGNSTNLNGAIKAGAEIWQNEISLDGINYGNLILFTDGIDTSGVTTDQAAIDAVQDKELYVIALGEEADVNQLQQYTNKSNIFDLADFSELEQVLTATFTRIKTYEDGLYVLSYATPKRAGSHTLTVTAKDDYTCTTAINDDESNELSNSGSISDCNDAQSYEFNANNFEDVSAQLLLSGSTPSLTNSVTWQADLRWTHDTPDFQWNIHVCTGNMDISYSETNDTATITRIGEGSAVALIEVIENTTNQSQQAYGIMVNNSSEFTSINISSLANLCSN